MKDTQWYIDNLVPTPEAVNKSIHQQVCELAEKKKYQIALPVAVHKTNKAEIMDAKGFPVAVSFGIDCDEAQAYSAEIIRVLNAHNALAASLAELVEVCRWKVSPNDEILLASGKSNHDALTEAYNLLESIKGEASQ